MRAAFFYFFYLHFLVRSFWCLWIDTSRSDFDQMPSLSLVYSVVFYGMEVMRGGNNNNKKLHIFSFVDMNQIANSLNGKSHQWIEINIHKKAALTQTHRTTCRSESCVCFLHVWLTDLPIVSRRSSIWDGYFKYVTKSRKLC